MLAQQSEFKVTVLKMKTLSNKINLIYCFCCIIAYFPVCIYHPRNETYEYSIDQNDMPKKVTSHRGMHCWYA